MEHKSKYLVAANALLFIKDSKLRKEIEILHSVRGQR